jgi:hypothetical protein
MSAEEWIDGKWIKIDDVELSYFCPECGIQVTITWV